jgi:hypothetical protein
LFTSSLAAVVAAATGGTLGWLWYGLPMVQRRRGGPIDDR